MICLGILLAGFGKPLYLLGTLALADGLYNYIPLVPVVSIYFAWTSGRLSFGTRPRLAPAMVPLLLGVALISVYLVRPSSGPLEDRLCYSTSAFVLLLIGVCLLFLTKEAVKSLVFPLGFLFLAVPIPSAGREAIETFLQHGSAWAAYVLFTITNTSLLRDGLTFHFGGFALHVAPECSGIRSTLMLFVTSVVAAQLLLRRPWSRVLLCAIVVPLGMLRNAIRIFTLGQLCIHIGPHMLDSYIHHRGGPIFFVAALLPFLLLLWLLRRWEQRHSPSRLTAQPC